MCISEKKNVPLKSLNKIRTLGECAGVCQTRKRSLLGLGEVQCEWHRLSYSNIFPDRKGTQFQSKSKSPSPTTSLSTL